MIDFLKQAAYTIYTWIYVLGGVFPYVPQYLEIRRSKKIQGFSTYVCLALLLANILRLCFWLVRPFSMPLLLQSIIMVVAMLAMMQLTSNVLHLELTAHTSPPLGPKTPGHATSRNIFTYPLLYFWKWTDFTSYVFFTVGFSSLSVAMTIFGMHSNIFAEVLGFSALFTEAMLGLPQFVRNYQNGSTEGMSLSMVAMWTMGDVAKTIFFWLEAAPLQFPLCGCLQISLDLAIFLQYIYYRRNTLSSKYHPISPRQLNVGGQWGSGNSPLVSP